MHEGGQHLERGGGVGVLTEAPGQLPAEALHDVRQRLLGEAHGVQVLVDLGGNEKGRREIVSVTVLFVVLKIFFFTFADTDVQHTRGCL